MPYVEGRTIHDADAHIMEAPNFLDDYVEARYAAEIRKKNFFGGIGATEGKDLFAIVRHRHDDPQWRAASRERILLREMPAAAKQRFYCDNFIDLMGAGLPADLRHPASQPTGANA